MKKDRLRDDNDPIRNVEDIIDARAERTSHIAGDVDSLEDDVEIPEDIDVDEALTFPHPKDMHHGHRDIEDIELMDTPNKEQTEEDYTHQDILPADYEDHYDDAIDQYATDDMDEVVEDKVHDLGQVDIRDADEEFEIEVMPSKFEPREEDTE